ncbi:MAG: hypothetical protein WCA27_22245, partial [Candidatus Sulfotelmatobacter sp.]
DGMTAHLTRATWGARCGKSARRVLRGGTGPSDLVARLVPTHHLTGGPVLNTSTKEVAGRLALLIDQLRNRYTLGYKPVTSKPEGTFCKLQLELQPEVYRDHPDLKKKDIMVRTKRGYYR